MSVPGLDPPNAHLRKRALAIPGRARPIVAIQRIRTHLIRDGCVGALGGIARVMEVRRSVVMGIVSSAV